ncbi:MAG: molybdopterin-dependent oxidoreductase, partial [Desulfovibrionales bacterium]|nr:molybdopterin-dependent oxidoreductase [Desulfovibrionales bacterium]
MEGSGEWKKTGCVLCAQNCGLEMRVQDHKLVAVRPDKENPRSRGYVCRKGMNVLNHQYSADRLTHPLKRVGQEFIPLSWDQALDEIAEKLRNTIATHGPRSLAYVGASAQGGSFEGAFGLGLIRGLGSRYFYSSAGQEFSGAWWVNGRVLGRQYHLAIPDETRSPMLVAWGWNGVESHQMPRAPLVLKEISKDPARTLVVVDPRRSETAALADIHLALRPGTDALLMKARIALILERGWEDRAYLEAYVVDFDRVRPWFENMDIPAALDLCELSLKTVEDLCRRMTRNIWCVHPDLGIYMGRHSALNSHLMMILGAVCGIFGREGGNRVAGMVMAMGSHADERDPRTWRTVATNLPPAAAGAFPPAVLPEEILPPGPDRLRAVMVSACNPLRSYPDTKAFERAFSALDLLVVNDIVLSETARLAHYVLPCRSYYEAWDGTFFPWTFPDIYFQMRRPLVPPPGACLESAQIFTRLARRLGLVPDIPSRVQKAARAAVAAEKQGEGSRGRMAFGGELLNWAGENPDVFKSMVCVLAETLGKEWDSATRAALWGMMMTAPDTFRENAARLGFEPGMDQGEKIFQAIMDHPQGLWVGRVDDTGVLEGVKTPSGKLELHIPELEDMARALSAEGESLALALPKEFPLILNAGRHTRYNANTLMR